MVCDIKLLLILFLIKIILSYVFIILVVISSNAAMPQRTATIIAINQPYPNNQSNGNNAGAPITTTQLLMISGIILKVALLMVV